METNSFPSIFRLRLFVQDENTGEPLANRILQATLSESDELSGIGQVLQTNAQGYVSFALEWIDPSPSKGEKLKGLPIRWWVSPFGLSQKGQIVEMRSSADMEKASVLRLDGEKVPSSAPNQWPHLSLADAADQQFAPNQWITRPIGQVGFGNCAKLIPNSQPKSCFPIRQFGLSSYKPVLLGHPIKERGLIQLNAYEGYLVEWEQCWLPSGYSIGNLLNSFPLAPCESVDISVLDYSRREKQSRTQDSVRVDESRYESSRDRLMVEAFRGSYNQNTFSFGNVSSLDLFVISSTTSIGINNVNTQTSSQAISALHESLTQSASAVSREHSVVVTEANAEERKTLSTRKITNHNHCHTLTIMYYEVLRNYLVTTHIKGHRKVILIQFPEITFTRENALCYAHILKSALLNPDLAGCFDALPEAICNRAITEEDCCATTLVNHLNCHKSYYSLRLAAGMDAATRIALFMKYTYQGAPLLNVIDPNPIGVLGNMLAFPLISSPLTPIYTQPQTTLITLPTKGVFAEGLLGNCNTCEVPVGGEFRDWKDSPCGCEGNGTPDGFGNAGSPLLGGSTLLPVPSGNLIQFPANPFGDPSSLLNGLFETFMNPDLLKDNQALEAAKEIATKMHESWSTFFESLSSAEQDSPLGSIASMVVNFLKGFLGS